VLGATALAGSVEHIGKARREALGATVTVRGRVSVPGRAASAPDVLPILATSCEIVAMAKNPSPTGAATASWTR
jgi:hypothetical protein